MKYRDENREAGAYLIIYAAVLIVLLTIMALVIDLSQARASKRSSQTTADLSALAAGPHLAGKVGATATFNVHAACQDAFQSLKANLSEIESLQTTSMPCTTLMTKSQCDAAASPGPTTITTDSPTPPVEVRFTYPVPDDLIADAQFAAGEADGDECERFMVEVERSEQSFFGGVVGYSGSSPTARAVIQARLGGSVDEVPAFVMLEREKCSVMWSSGGIAVVEPAENGQPGVITVDSHGQTTQSGAPGCNNSAGPNSKVLFATETPWHDEPNKIPAIQALDGTDGPARIHMYALNAAVVSSSGYVDRSAHCHTGCGPQGADTNPGIVPPPIPGDIVSRSPLDRRYNRTILEDLYPEPWSPTTTGAVAGFRAHAAEAQSRAAAIVAECSVEDGCPETYGYESARTIQGAECTAAHPAPITEDFVFVNCPSEQPSDKGFEPGGDITFEGRDFVFSGAINVKNTAGLAFTDPNEIVIRGRAGNNYGLSNSGNLRVNTGAGPSDGKSCDIREAENPGPTRIIVQRGRFETSGSTTLCQSFVFLAGTPTDTSRTSGGSTLANCSLTLPCPADAGPTDSAHAYLSIQGPVDWSAPNQFVTRQPQTREHPFEDLALWVESPSSSVIKSSAAVSTVGVFFLPNATLEFQGPSTLTPRAAQFFARRLNLSGGGIRLQPDPNDSVDVPTPGSFQLIR